MWKTPNSGGKSHYPKLPLDVNKLQSSIFNHKGLRKLKQTEPALILIGNLL